ncbi:Prophage endopeptidase tail [Planococcus massiliensis]|uniref:Prophage endopeptidase tail n=1 Tax=Planococcus massiliensis TaxID=1499687 RepID=A0A098EMV2_9BACL|nr:phage tail spike protein [Planococcus massiliensis]CEG23122.1 Prophage endopeptidase tail [Planococcus massiliensis]
MSNWDGGRTFITIRDNDTYEELGVAYDLMNTSIYEEINNKFTLDFNILPYFNVYRIMHPNFVELNGNYFRIRRIEKKRTNSLMMAISCEHISYELNNPYELDAANEDIELPDDYPYEGTPREILEEMLQGTRFSIGAVHFNQSVQFTSKPMGTRSMIIGLANEIGAEVVWDKFTISLVARRGADRNLSFEVGKNLLSMTEVYEIHANGAYNRFYDVDVIDLSRIKDENAQQELYDIQLGDTVTLIDEQFNINISQRVVSHEIDPFRKELPKIQLEHVRKSITGTIADVSSSITDLKRMKPVQGGGGSSEVVIDFVPANFSDPIINWTDAPTDLSKLVRLRVVSEDYPVTVTGPSNLIAGLKILGEASEPTTLQGGLLIEVDGVVMPLNNSFVNTTLNPGFNTIGFPFSFPYFDESYKGKDIFIYMQLIISAGTLRILKMGTSMYLKGPNLIVSEPTNS